MKNKIRTGLGAFFGMLILILDGKTALEGAQEGVDLCIRTVIPSLFPFFVLSILLTGAFTESNLPILRPLGKLFYIPNGAEALLIPAFLGGYPAGAQSIAQAYRQHHLDKKNAERLLAFSNNAGPAFLFGMTSAHFPKIGLVWLLWFVHIFSAFLVSRLFPAEESRGSMSGQTDISLPDSMVSALKVMAQVCGWVILFRVVIAFLDRWILWIMPPAIQVTLTGLLELSNGCCTLNNIGSISLRFFVCSGMLAFGGLCVTMQTVSVTSGLSLKRYFQGKFLQTLFSLILSAGILWQPLLLLPVLILLIPQKFRKSSRNPATVGV